MSQLKPGKSQNLWQMKCKRGNMSMNLSLSEVSVYVLKVSIETTLLSEESEAIVKIFQ